MTKGQLVIQEIINLLYPESFGFSCTYFSQEIIDNWLVTQSEVSNYTELNSVCKNSKSGSGSSISCPKQCREMNNFGLK